MSTQTTSSAPRCESCGQDSGAAIPTAVGQPFLDALAFANPETLRQSLQHGEVVLVQCRANVGGLVGTNRRVLLIKNGQAHEHSYAAIEDITIEKVGWVLDAVCQLVTATSPHQKLKSKQADQSPSALSLVRVWMATFGLAKARLLNIRDSRKCHSCGAFVPIEGDELRVAGRSELLDPIPSGGVDVLAPRLEAGENILLQVHGERFYKSLIVTDRRAILVQGRAEKRFYAYPLAAIAGAEGSADGLRLQVAGRPVRREEGIALVGSDSALPGNEGDLARFAQAAALINELRPG